MPGNVRDNNDGTYKVDYLATIAGAYTVGVLMGVQNIEDSPFALRIMESAIEPTKCTGSDSTTIPVRTPALIGTGLTGMTAGVAVEGSVLVKAYDRFGNPRTTGGDSFDVYVRGVTNTYSLLGEVVDLGTGKT